MYNISKYDKEIQIEVTLDNVLSRCPIATEVKVAASGDIYLLAETAFLSEYRHIGCYTDMIIELKKATYQFIADIVAIIK